MQHLSGYLYTTVRCMLLLLTFAPIALFGCAADANQHPPPTGHMYVVGFPNGTDGFISGFADLPPNYDPGLYTLDSAWDSQPDPLPPGRKALRIEGHNRSDDLFMFVKRRVTGLRPNADYAVSFDVTFLSNAPADAIGAGGGPGTDVFLKVGALSFEPRGL